MSRNKQSMRNIDPVADNMARLRKSRHYTQRELSKELHIPLSKIARTEVGILKPSVELIRLYMKHLKVTSNALFFDPGEDTIDAAIRIDIGMLLEREEGSRLRRIQEMIELAVKTKDFEIRLIPTSQKNGK